uniref:Uncharacterized protein n=1 Tax=Mycena chlorophos TaxID=658473 RepID=A0ABQ0M5J1_MYCCL|nr:predicted protein [Mycena chlorophos]
MLRRRHEEKEGDLVPRACVATSPAVERPRDPAALTSSLLRQLHRKALHDCIVKRCIQSLRRARRWST